MKLTAKQIDSFIKKPDAAVQAVLIYGPDEGLIDERSRAIARSWLGVDPTRDRVTELTPADLKANPSLLHDELASMSLLGDRQIIRLREAGDSQTKRIAALFEEGRHYDHALIVNAENLGPRSSLRKLFEKEPMLASIPCYHDESGDLQTLVTNTLREAGKQPAPDVIPWLVQHLGGDRRVTRSELEKLLLYVGNLPEVTLDDAREMIGDSTALELDALIDAVFSGQTAEADRVLQRLTQEGIHAVQILRSLSLHVDKLLHLHALAQQGQSIDMAIKQYRPPIFYKQQPMIRRHLNRWNAAILARATTTLLRTERDCKRTGAASELLCGDAVLRLARHGRLMARAKP